MGLTCRVRHSQRGSCCGDCFQSRDGDRRGSAGGALEGPDGTTVIASAQVSIQFGLIKPGDWTGQAFPNSPADHSGRLRCQSRSGGVPQRVNLSVLETARENFLKWVVERHSRDSTVHSPRRVHRMRNLRGYFLCLLPAWSSSPFGAASVATLVPARKAYQQPFEPPKVVLMPTMALSMAVPP